MPTSTTPKPKKRSKATTTKETSPAAGIVTSFPVVVVHAPGRNEGRAVCAALVAGIPAGAPILWGGLIERQSALEAAISELEAWRGAADRVRGGTGRVEPCSGCLSNLRKMRDADQRKLAGGRRGRP